MKKTIVLVLSVVLFVFGGVMACAPVTPEPCVTCHTEPTEAPAIPCATCHPLPTAEPCETCHTEPLPEGYVALQPMMVHDADSSEVGTIHQYEEALKLIYKDGREISIDIPLNYTLESETWPPGYESLRTAKFLNYDHVIYIYWPDAK